MIPQLPAAGSCEHASSAGRAPAASIVSISQGALAPPLVACRANPNRETLTMSRITCDVFYIFMNPNRGQ